MGDDKRVLQKTFETTDTPDPQTIRPIQLGVGRVNQLVHSSPCVEVRPIERDGVITEHKYLFADGTVFYVSVSPDISGSFTVGSLAS